MLGLKPLHVGDLLHLWQKTLHVVFNVIEIHVSEMNAGTALHVNGLTEARPDINQLRHNAYA